MRRHTGANRQERRIGECGAADHASEEILAADTGRRRFFPTRAEAHQIRSVRKRKSLERDLVARAQLQVDAAENRRALFHDVRAAPLGDVGDRNTFEVVLDRAEIVDGPRSGPAADKEARKDPFDSSDPRLLKPRSRNKSLETHLSGFPAGAAFDLLQSMQPCVIMLLRFCKTSRGWQFTVPQLRCATRRSPGFTKRINSGHS